MIKLSHIRNSGKGTTHWDDMTLKTWAKPLTGHGPEQALKNLLQGMAD